MERIVPTPHDGLGLHLPAQAKHIVDLTNQVARRLGTQTQGMRLTVGA